MPISQSQTPPERVLNIGCGQDYHEDAHNVDVIPETPADEVLDLQETPWPYPDSSIHCIRAFHVLEHMSDLEVVLRECHRVLSSGGVLQTKWPIGLDARADPDHERVWTWRTPEFWTGARHWDSDIGLELERRDVDLWSHLPSKRLRKLHQWWLSRRLKRDGPGPWCFGMPATSGEYSVIFRAP